MSTTFLPIGPPFDTEESPPGMFEPVLEDDLLAAPDRGQLAAPDGGLLPAPDHGLLAAPGAISCPPPGAIT